MDYYHKNVDVETQPIFVCETHFILRTTYLHSGSKDRIGEDGTAGCLAFNKYAVLPPCGRHGRLPANLTVSFIARK